MTRHTRLLLGLLVPTMLAGLLFLPIAARTDPKEIEVFESPRTSSLKNVREAQAKDLYYQDVDRKPFEQCWYYLAVADDGTVFFCHFNAVKVNFAIKVYSLDFELCLPHLGDHFFAHAYKEDEVKWATDRLFLQMGKNRVEGTLKEQKIHIEEVDYVVDLNFQATVPAFREGSGKIYLDHEKKDYMDMTFQPAMRFEGTIKTKGETRPIKGWAYSDHLAATFITTDLAKSLDSVRIHAGDLFISAFEFHTVPKYLPHRIPILMVIYKGQLIYWGNDFQFNATRTYEDAETGLEAPKNFTLERHDGSFNLECSGRGTLLQRVDALATVNAVVRKLLKLAGISSYAYVFREDVQCKIDAPKASGTFKGDGILEALYSK